MNDPREVWHLPLQSLGQRVLVFDSTDSTNSRAAALAFSPGNHGVAILADVQTAGRGQKGRTWSASPGSSVLLSLLLFPSPSLNRPAILTGWAACAVCAVVERLTGKKTQIKWPNDILVDGNKICGILIEQNQGVVVGIGLNVSQSTDELLQAGLTSATSLAVIHHSVPSSYEVARQLLGQLDTDYQSLSRGLSHLIEQRWIDRLGLLQQEVILECSKEKHCGRLVGLSFDALDLLTETGLHHLEPERVHHVFQHRVEERPISS